MASADDLRCMRELVEQLQAVADTQHFGSGPAGRGGAPVAVEDAEQEAIELLALVPEVLSADTHSGRLAALLRDNAAVIGPAAASRAGGKSLRGRYQHPASSGPIATISEGFLSLRLAVTAKMRLAAIKTLTRITAIVTNAGLPSSPPQPQPHHHATALESLFSTLMEPVLPLLVDIAVNDGLSLTEAAAAAELVFVLCMKGGAALRGAMLTPQDRNLERLLTRLWETVDQPSSAPHHQRQQNGPKAAELIDLRNYLAAIARVFIDRHADFFTTARLDFSRNALATIADVVGADGNRANQRDSLDNVAVLLLETLSALLAAFPSQYWTQIASDDAAASALLSVVDGTFGPDADVAQLGPSADTVLNAAAALFEAVLTVEGLQYDVAVAQSNQQQQPRDGRVADEKTGQPAQYLVSPVLHPYLASVSQWFAATEAASTDALAFRRLRLQRYAVAAAFSRPLIEGLQTGFLQAFPQVCNLLLPDRSSRRAIQEAAVVFALMCAKAPAVRAQVLTMVSEYQPWAAQLCATIVRCLERDVGSGPQSPPRVASNDTPELGILRKLVIVDVNQAILSDGEQAQNVPSFDEYRIAQALLDEQDRRYARKAPPEPLEGDAIRFYLTAHDGDAAARATAIVRDRTLRLVLAVLSVASTVALKGPTRAGEDADAVTPQHASSPRARLDTSGMGGVPTPLRGAAVRKSTTPQRSRTPNAASRAANLAAPSAAQDVTAYQRWLRARSGAASKRGAAAAGSLGAFFDPVRAKEPFRPASARSTLIGKQPSGAAATSLDGSFNNGSTPPPPPAAVPGAGPLLDAVRNTRVEGDEYLSMALMMHLPIRFAPHYNRQSKASVMRIEVTPKAKRGQAQPPQRLLHAVHRNTTQSWTAADVLVGELYVLFVPFQAISSARLNEEIDTVEQHELAMKRLLVTTPAQHRSRRWFLTDMLHYVLPKTVLLLRDFLTLLHKFGAQDVVYQMSVIRLSDEGRKEHDSAFQAAVLESDPSMPEEVLRFGTRKFKDILHSGNIDYAVARLRDHYYGAGSRLDDISAELSVQDLLGGAAAAPSGGVYDEDGFLQRQRASPRGGGGSRNEREASAARLDAIDREIERLERRASEDQWARAQQTGTRFTGDDDDDVASDFERFAPPASHRKSQSDADGAASSTAGTAAQIAAAHWTRRQSASNVSVASIKSSSTAAQPPTQQTAAATGGTTPSQPTSTKYGARPGNLYEVQHTEPSPEPTFYDAARRREEYDDDDGDHDDPLFEPESLPPHLRQRLDEIDSDAAVDEDVGSLRGGGNQRSAGVHREQQQQQLQQQQLQQRPSGQSLEDEFDAIYAAAA